MQYLSPELSKRLTELTQENIAEIIQNKRYYVESKDHGIMVVCGHRIKWGEDSQELKVICPAWQVEDVLRNLDKLNGEFCKVYPSEIAEKIAKCFFFYSTDTAYQKIEEYLWQILWINKEVLCCGGLGSITKGECGRGTKTGCVGMHCKCMQKDCSNMHYVDCREHYIHVEHPKK